MGETLQQGSERQGAEWHVMVERTDRSAIEQQKAHWEHTFEKRDAMFGAAPSHPALYAVGLFEKEKCRRVLELGAGQGRDTFHFARRGFAVTALDYSDTGLSALEREARRAGLSGSITTLQHDVQQPLPFANETYDACYSHMLYCMALPNAVLESLSQEIRRILKPGGLNVYSARNTEDADYGQGVHRGEGMYEANGFIVHFFSTEMVQRLAKGYELVALEEFEEGSLPRKLFLVTLKKAQEARLGS